MGILTSRSTGQCSMSSDRCSEARAPVKFRSAHVTTLDRSPVAGCRSASIEGCWKGGKLGINQKRLNMVTFEVISSNKYSSTGSLCRRAACMRGTQSCARLGILSNGFRRARQMLSVGSLTSERGQGFSKFSKRAHYLYQTIALFHGWERLFMWKRDIKEGRNENGSVKKEKG